MKHSSLNEQRHMSLGNTPLPYHNTHTRGVRIPYCACSLSIYLIPGVISNQEKMLYFKPRDFAEGFYLPKSIELQLMNH